MLGQEQDKDRRTGGGGLGVNRKTYLRSASWTDRSPRAPNPRPPLSGKARFGLPALQPLSISRPSFEEWPRAGSDDLGVWPQAPTPTAKGSVKQLHNSNSKQPKEEFLFKKDKLAFFDKECSRIVDHIYLGSDAVAKNREIFRKNCITHVLNCVGFVCPEYFKNELVYKTLWLQDSPSEDITSILYDVFDYFEDVREQGGRVLVHCCQGVSRSTSLVIAYLMWRERQTFEEAFQNVKAARGVTNPNMGFACQLLLCQKRTLAFLESPNSVLRMYRIAPHSPYDPLHLVPKMLNHPGAQALDSRGSFVIHVPSAVYVWIGKHCVSAMSDNARKAAYQVIRYEMAKGPVITIEEGKEWLEFWDALVNRKSLSDGCGELETQQEGKYSLCSGVGERKVDLYDLDFEIYQKALVGGVVPLFPLSGTRLETCLPARENGWGRLKQKFLSGSMKEFIESSKLSCETTEPSDTTMEIDHPGRPTEPPSPSSSSSSGSELNNLKDTCKEVKYSVPLASPVMSPTPSCSSLDSFASFLVSSPKFSSKSPTLSPSTSDYSSSFTFSPSSSTWSDLSYLSPSTVESPNQYPSKDTSSEENACLLCEGNSPVSAKDTSGNHAPSEANECLPCKGIIPSIADRRGSNPRPLVMLPSVSDGSHVPSGLVRSCSFSLLDLEDEVMLDREQSKLDADMLDAGNQLHSQVHNRIDDDTFRLPCSDTTTWVTEAEATNFLLYEWPSMDKVQKHRFTMLDSRSVYVAFISDVSLDSTSHNAVYIWLGREVSTGKVDRETSLTGRGTVGHDFLEQMGLPLDFPAQVVREGEEPEHLLKHLYSFSFQEV